MKRSRHDEECERYVKRQLRIQDLFDAMDRAPPQVVTEGLSEWYQSLCGAPVLPPEAELATNRVADGARPPSYAHWVRTPETVYFYCSPKHGVADAYLDADVRVAHPLDDTVWPFRPPSVDIGDDMWVRIFEYVAVSTHVSLIDISGLCKRFRAIIRHDGRCWLPFFARWAIDIVDLTPAQYYMCAVKYSFISPTRWCSHNKRKPIAWDPTIANRQMKKDAIRFLSQPAREIFLARLLWRHFYQHKSDDDIDDVEVLRGLSWKRISRTGKTMVELIRVEVRYPDVYPCAIIRNELCSVKRDTGQMPKIDLLGILDSFTPYRHYYESPLSVPM